MPKCVFETEAVQQVKYKDGSGETSIWTDGLVVSTCDARQDNFSGIKLEAGKKYKVTVEVEELT